MNWTRMKPLPLVVHLEKLVKELTSEEAMAQLRANLEKSLKAMKAMERFKHGTVANIPVVDPATGTGNKRS